MPARLLDKNLSKVQMGSAAAAAAAAASAAGNKERLQISDSLVAEWEQKILSKFMKGSLTLSSFFRHQPILSAVAHLSFVCIARASVSGFTALEAKLNYLDYVQEWTFYGATFFTVEQRQFKDYPSPLTLGINCEGVLLMHPEKRTVLENYAYTDIVTWGHSDEKFIGHS
jgi:hypothetical protein